MARLTLAIIAVPIFALLVASGLLWKMESDWQSALAKQFPDAPAERRAAITIQFACADPATRSSISDFCNTVHQFRVMEVTAATTALAGPLWLALIAFAGRLARRSRRVLLYVFRPGLYLTNLLLVVLVVTHAALALAVIYFGEAALIGRIHVGIMVAIGLGALLGVLAILRVSFSLVKSVVTTVVGKPVSATDAPELWRFAQNVASSVGVEPPDNIVVGLEPNFFVTEVAVKALGGPLRGRTMFLSLPLSRILTQDEARGILGHELGHYKGQDTKFSRKFYPIYRGTAEALHSLAAAGGSDEGAGHIALLPAIVILSFFLKSFSVAENTISRERELAADKVGAAVVGPKATASALVKVYAFSGYWLALRAQMEKILKEGKIFTNASETFSNLVAAVPGIDALANLDNQRPAHPTDSHPPLALRLENLHVTLADVQEAALNTKPGNAAITLLPDHEAIEKELSEIEHYLLARSLGISEATPSTENHPTASPSA